MKAKAGQKLMKKTTLKKDASRVHFGGQNGSEIDKNYVILGVAFLQPVFWAFDIQKSY